jgi:predicted DNA-binding transcriptional regulator AlpA
MAHELMFDPECGELTRLHRSTRERLAKQGQFPKPIKIGDPNPRKNGRIAWSRAEVEAWLEERMNARHQQPSTPQRHVLSEKLEEVSA